MRAKFISLLFKTNRLHVAVHLSSNRSQRTSKCGKNIIKLSPRVSLFCSYRILTSSVIYYRTDARQHEIYLLNGSISNISFLRFTIEWDLSSMIGVYVVWEKVKN